MDRLKRSWDKLDNSIKGVFTYPYVEKQLCDSLVLKLTAGKAPELREFFKSGTLHSFSVIIYKGDLNTWTFECGRIKITLLFKLVEYKEINTTLRELQDINLQIKE